MIDIYNEITYIKNILEQGISSKWERDATLLTRYYKTQGYAKKDIKTTLLQKCLQAASRPTNPIDFRESRNAPRLYSVVDKAWKITTPLRQIESISIPREVVDWFLSLSSQELLTPEEIPPLKERRPGLTITTTPIDWNRTKYLFTLYIWTLIQANYLERPNIHYLKKFTKRFKHDADLPISFSLPRQRDLLYDLKFLDVNAAMGVIPAFMSLPVFQTPLTPENTLTLTAGEPWEGDLYTPGYWLLKQKMGSFICHRCGKEFARPPRSHSNLRYCKKCQDVVRGKNKTGLKRNEAHLTPRFCLDCHEEIPLLKPNDFVTIYCPDCKKKHKKEQQCQNTSQEI